VSLFFSHSSIRELPPSKPFTMLVSDMQSCSCRVVIATSASCSGKLWFFMPYRDNLRHVFMLLNEQEQLLCPDAFMPRLAQKINPTYPGLGQREVIRLMDAGAGLTVSARNSPAFRPGMKGGNFIRNES
jgi:hypothetical protein